MRDASHGSQKQADARATIAIDNLSDTSTCRTLRELQSNALKVAAVGENMIISVRSEESLMSISMYESNKQEGSMVWMYVPLGGGAVYPLPISYIFAFAPH